MSVWFCTAFLPELLSGTFCGSERSGDRSNASVISKIIAVEGNGGSVRILESLLRLEGLAEDIAVDHAILEVAHQIVYVGLDPIFAILLDQFHISFVLGVDEVGLSRRPSGLRKTR